MKMTATITINENLIIPIKGAAIDEQGDLRLIVDRATKKALSVIACFPVHTVAIVMGDFDCALVLERKGANANGSMCQYEENSMIFQLTNQNEANRIYCKVANA